MPAAKWLEDRRLKRINPPSCSVSTSNPFSMSAKKNTSGPCVVSTNQQPRRSMGFQTSHIRSPSVKRSATAPIALQGWLHKQGSEGLMLWKKRWFVLTEYCLFYYKTPEEEKLLGSILLPSYRISPCSAMEGKMFRKKYSFKAEHANMRTYYFAADSREQMVQWMNAMSLASIAQQQPPLHAKNGNHVQKYNNGVVHRPEKDNVNFSFHDTYNTPTNWIQEQPLYVNAPPKPRRIAEPSPERKNYAIRNDRIYPSPYNANRVEPETHVETNRNHMAANYNDHERRTPDVYGRTTDYEELYNLAVSCNRDGNNTRVSLVKNIRKSKQCERPHSADFLDDSRAKPQTVLEMINAQGEAYKHSQPPRPKSSIDTLDNLHWTEERYAQKMRKSAQYLVAKTNPADLLRTPTLPPTINDMDDLVKHEPEFTRSISARVPKQMSDLDSPDVEEPVYKRRNSLHSRETNDKYPQVQQREESMKRLLEWKQRMLQSPLSRKSSDSSNRTAHNDLFKHYKSSMTPDRRDWSRQNRSDGSWDLSIDVDDESVFDGKKHRKDRKKDGRSSVSSLKFNSESDEEEPDKAKESRKRGRRTSQVVNEDTTVKRNGECVIDIDEPDTKIYESTKQVAQCRASSNIVCSSISDAEDIVGHSLHSDSGYDTLKANCYSSETSNKSEMSNLKLIRSSTTEQKCESPVQNIVQKRIKVFEKTDKPDGDEKPDSLQLQEPLKVVHNMEMSRAEVSPVKCKVEETNVPHDKNSSISDIEDGASNKVDGELSTTNYSPVDRTPVGAEADNQLYEAHYLPMSPFRKPSFISPGDLFSHTRTNSASSASQILILETLLSEEIAENSYVEMMMSNNERKQNLLKSILEETTIKEDNDCKSHYEFLYKASSSSEPLYMEVGGLKLDSPADSSAQPSALPDILNSSNLKLTKSDSSDADDEASKELDPLEVQNHPRFSLSDTFRPASYYLGVGASSRNILSSDQPDSSDSDLVSPPPIPSSLPPMDDFDASLELLPTTEDKTDTSLSNEWRYSLESGIRTKDEVFDTDSCNSKSSFSSLKKVTRDKTSDLDSTGSCSSMIMTLPDLDHDNYDDYIKHLREASLTSFEKLSLNKIENDKRTYENLEKTNVSENSKSYDYDADTSNINENSVAPYYYADLLAGKSFDTQHLNNQRESTENLNKRDVGRKVNQISEENLKQMVKNCAALMDVKNTVKFMDISDKNTLDDKNIYSSHKFNKTSYRSKTPEPLSDAINLYTHCTKVDNPTVATNELQRRSRSLEGLLDVEPEQPPPVKEQIPTDIWEEDSLWRESLRNTSLRHARSLDDLDRDEKPKMNSGRQSADILSNSTDRKPKLSRDVTYVNDCVTTQIRKAKQNHKEYTEDYREVRKIKRYVRLPVNADDGVHYERLDPRATLRPQVPQEMKQHGKFNTQPKSGAQSFLEEGVYPTRPPSFEIDREKLRQWDLMSSAPAGMLSAIQRSHPVEGRGLAEKSVTQPSDTPPPPSPASGSGSVIGRDPLPPRNLTTLPAVQTYEKKADQFDSHYARDNRQYARSPLMNEISMKKDGAWSLNVSAGELLGRTHEELVLLLIQLRRQSASICKAMENCHHEIESQAHLAELETPDRIEQLNKLEELKRKLYELEKHYEKGKPLVNLVDNMVKLGSLYRAGIPAQTTNFREKLEFNHKLQEQRLLLDEKKAWERLSPDHSKLQAKVEELYKLDRELQTESSTLQSLKQDKELLETALGGLKYKIQGTLGNPSELERYKRQQLLLEKELSHVRSVLARNSKKLEETVTANARLESELILLRQKMHSDDKSDSTVTGPTVAALEAELRRVQMLVGDLQRQRNELGIQVRHLTEKSKTLCEQFIRPSSTGIAGAGPVPSRKRATGWMETDLDHPHRDSTNSSPISPSLYVNADDRKTPLSDYAYSSTDYLKKSSFSDGDSPLSPSSSESQFCRPFDINDADDRMKKFYGIIPRDKPQEIKTVRIVKRESERRQRDRDRNGNIGIPIGTCNSKRPCIPEETNYEQEDRYVSTMEDRYTDDCLNEHIYSLRTNPTITLTSPVVEKDPIPPPPRSDSIQVVRSMIAKNQNTDMQQFAKEAITNDRLYYDKEQKHDTVGSISDNSPQLSPVYQSEAAKQIVQEIVKNKVNLSNGDINRRMVPRERRRHHTLSSSKPIMPMDAYMGTTARARDDVDMERALRPRTNAPDVVRSTLSRADARYDAHTIDMALGTPGKILIPERYVPEVAPELTPEEQSRRHRKAEAIRKMLSETALAATDNEQEDTEKSPLSMKKLEEEKRQRNHILQLNQILAQQVMERSKQVAVRALSELELNVTSVDDEDDQESPPAPLPLYQQRENYFT